MLVTLAGHMAGATDAARLLSTLAGAVLIARAVNDAALARTILQAAAGIEGLSRG